MSVPAGPCRSRRPGRRAGPPRPRPPAAAPRRGRPARSRSPATGRPRPARHVGGARLARARAESSNQSRPSSSERGQPLRSTKKSLAKAMHPAPSRATPAGARSPAGAEAPLGLAQGLRQGARRETSRKMPGSGAGRSPRAGCSGRSRRGCAASRSSTSISISSARVLACSKLLRARSRSSGGCSWLCACADLGQSRPPGPGPWVGVEQPALRASGHEDRVRGGVEQAAVAQLAGPQGGLGSLQVADVARHAPARPAPGPARRRPGSR